MGDKSPYMGVLVSPERYRVYTLGRLESKAIQKELDVYLSSPPAPDIEFDQSTMSLIGWFGTGLLVGLTAGLLLHR